MDSWNVEKFEDIELFYKSVESFLLENEVRNNLIIAILRTIKEKPNTYGEEDPVLIKVSKNNLLKMVAIRTPPFNLIISYTDQLKAIDELVSYLMDKKEKLPGVLGFKKGANLFAEKWTKETQQKFELEMNERIYKLEKVNENLLKPSSNQFVTADLEYESIILDWAEKFILEAVPDQKDEIENSLKRTKEQIKEGKLFLLLNQDKPVSMARMAGETVNGRLVNLVYTPPHLRNKGFASEVVARLSQYILDLGYNFCLLFTDLSNPTSNKIYMNIGYKPIIDVDMYRFVDE